MPSTPVIDNFSETFESLIQKDHEKGIDYFYREREISLILKFLLKKEKQHIAIIGEIGTGRETLIKTVASKTEKRSENLTLNSFSFKKLDYDALVAGAKYRGQLEERVQAIITELERNENIVFYIKDLYSQLTGGNLDAPVRINTRRGKSRQESGSSFPASNNSKILLSLLRNQKSKIITILTSEEAETLFDYDNTLTRLFNVIKQGPPNKSETLQILKKHISRYNKSYSVKISDTLLESVIEYSNLYLPNEFQPLKSLALLEEASASIELNKFSNPQGDMLELKIGYDKLDSELGALTLEKNEAVKTQQFEKAAGLRDREKGIIENLEKLQEKIFLKNKENVVEIKEDDLVEAIHNQTGIEIEKIKNKEKVVARTSQTLQVEYSGLPQFEFLQTQSILHGHQISIKSGLAFVLIPHNKEFDDLFFHNIKPSLEFYGLSVLKADSIYKPGNILSQVWAQIRTAEVIIADVSGQNPNVIFELGLCYGIQRCPILLTRDPIELPFNIRNLRYIQYDNTASGAHKLGEDLKTSVGEFLSAVRSDIF
jgi:hypothetical protein